MDLREIQSVAKSRGLYSGKIDGIWGQASKDACEALIRSQSVDPGSWPEGRLTIGAGQAICRSLGIEAGLVDGFMGPQTQYAFDVYKSRKDTGQVPSPEETWRDEPAPPVKPVASQKVWPTQAGVPKFFGAVGSNQASLTLPYAMKLAWAPTQKVTKITCHKLVSESFEKVFKNTLDYYGQAGIRDLRLDLFGGCLNVRRMRGGSAWSMHAWGIAIDIDPSNNALRTKKPQATLSQDVYLPFWGFVESEGLVSLGRARNFDWMHFQAARV